MFRLILTTLYTWRARRWKLKYEEQQANEDNCGCCYSTKYHNINYVNPMNKYNFKNPIIDLE